MMVATNFGDTRLRSSAEVAVSQGRFMILELRLAPATEPSNRETAPASTRSEEMNRSTCGQWAAFGSHRERIERLILRHLRKADRLLLESPPARLCALGAGNCNDLDLRFLCDRVGEVHLLDIDAAALEAAAGRQRAGNLANLHRHAPVDLTAPGDLPDRLGRFDIVVSSCVLSQLIAGLRDRLGAEHPRFRSERTLTIAHHLRLMHNLLAPGGSAILINDVVSTDTVPRLRQVPPGDLPGLMRQLIADGKAFRGLDPATICFALDRLPVPVVRNWSSPWLWHLSALRSFLVYGLVFRVQGSGFSEERRRRANTETCK